MIIDSHCHIDFEAFDDDRDQVIQRAQHAGVQHLIVPGVSAHQWPKLQRICQQYPNLHACYGLHPYFIEQHTTQQLEDLKRWLTTGDAVGIGECGLDFYLTQLDKHKQQRFFEAQLDIALETQLPVVIHSRKATTRVIECLAQRTGLRGMIHSFSGSFEQAMQLIKLGFYISLGGAITYHRATRLRNIAAKLPLDYLLIETDAPDQPSSQQPQQRNEPAYIVNVIDTLHSIRKEDKQTIINTTTQNLMHLFNITDG